jgi:precorrin-6B methylase 2
MNAQPSLPSGWFGSEDIKVYRALVSTLPTQGKLIEIGCHYGRSLCSIADIIKAKQLKVYAIDIFEDWEYDGEKWTGPLVLQRFIDNINTFGIYKNVTIIKDRSDYIGYYLPSVNMVFIDGDHSYDQVTKELLQFKNKTRKLCGHDYNQPVSVKNALLRFYKEEDIILFPGSSIWQAPN